MWWLLHAGTEMVAAAMATLIARLLPLTEAMVGCRPAVRQRWNCSRDSFSVVAEDGDGEPSGLSSPCLQLELLSYLMILSWIVLFNSLMKMDLIRSSLCPTSNCLECSLFFFIRFKFVSSFALNCKCFTEPYAITGLLLILLFFNFVVLVSVLQF